MELELKLAFKNLFGARLRTLLNVLVLSFSFVIIIFLNSIMDGLQIPIILSPSRRNGAFNMFKKIKDYAR